MDHLQITYNNIGIEQQEILIATLSLHGYEGFEQDENSLKAFINSKEFDESLLSDLSNKTNVPYSKQIIKEQNWNRQWESSFDPVIIGDFVAIRAGFHSPVSHVRHELIVTPKMSFGTGHHATTYLMISEMSKIDFHNKTVMDFGTGTGVLAMLAEKLGAVRITAIDNDAWSIENAFENIHNNGCIRIQLMKAESAAVPQSYGIILANINRNVIIENLEEFSKRLDEDGVLLVSGLLGEEDADLVCSQAYKSGFHYHSGSEKDNWRVIKFIR